jgi:hypothetical protein
MGADIKLEDELGNNPLFYAEQHKNRIKNFSFSEETQKILNENEQLQLENAFIENYINKKMLSE